MTRVNKERNEEMVRMRQNGATYAEIAKRFGVSKQRVSMILGQADGAKFKPFTPERCVYPILRKWPNDNKVSVAELTRRMYGNASANNHKYVRVILRGCSKDIRKPTIDKLIKATGLKYEQLFYKE